MLIQKGTTTCAFSPEIKCPGKQKVNAQSKAEKAKVRGRIQKHSSVQSPISCPRDSEQRAHHTSAHLHQKHTQHSSPLCFPRKDSLLNFGDCCSLGCGVEMTVVFHTPISQYWTLAQHDPSAGCTASVPQQGQGQCCMWEQSLGASHFHTNHKE